MTAALTLTNARVVTPDDVFLGTVLIQQGRISEIAQGTSQIAGAVDCQGDYLMPGLVELHTDHLEQHVAPRPKVRWNAAAAVFAHDGQMAAAGVTTVFDALSLGDVMPDSARLSNLQSMAEGITRAQQQGYLRADHRLHLRCEVSAADSMTLFHALVDNPLVGIVSLMDHTPGQRQFVNEDKYRDYYMGKYRLNETELDQFTERQQENSARFAEPHRQEIAAISRARGFTLASHDDATPEHIAHSKALGCDFAEFPTTVAAAAAARAAGLGILMGAPNLVLGGSHSGNVATADLARAGLLDLISSDYVPVSLIHAVFLLTRAEVSYSLPAAVATATRLPAEMAGLDDRGEIAIGRRGDLLRVHDDGAVPVVRAVWREGHRIA